MKKNLLKSILNCIIKIFKKNTIQSEEKSIEILPKFTAKKLYVNSQIGLRVRSRPEIKSNNILEVLNYGQEVIKIEEQNKWFKVKYNFNKEGWVSSVYLIENKLINISQITKKENFQDNTFPKFKIGIANLANSDNTIKLRKIINYEFGLDFDKDELQCTEYVQYRAQQLGIKIQWPVKTNRNGSNWANIFEKYGLYKILDSPKAKCAMSFTSGFRTPAMNTIGHVAFVEQVFDDGSIKITEANWPRPGKYNERKMSKSEWQTKYKCRFVDFS